MKACLLLILLSLLPAQAQRLHHTSASHRDIKKLHFEYDSLQVDGKKVDTAHVNAVLFPSQDLREDYAVLNLHFELAVRLSQGVYKMKKADEKNITFTTPWGDFSSPWEKALEFIPVKPRKAADLKRHVLLLLKNEELIAATLHSIKDGNIEVVTDLPLPTKSLLIPQKRLRAIFFKPMVLSKKLPAGILNEKTLPLLDFHSSISSIDCRLPLVTAAVLDKLNELSVSELSLENSRLNAGTLQSLAGIKTLEKLNLKNAVFTPDDAACLASLPALKEINLEGCATSLKLTEALSRLKTLETLKLSFTDVNDSDIQALSGLTNLLDLDLFSTAVSSQSIAPLLKLTGLKFLDIRKTALTEGDRKRLRSKIQRVL